MSGYKRFAAGQVEMSGRTYYVVFDAETDAIIRGSFKDLDTARKVAQEMNAG